MSCCCQVRSHRFLYGASTGTLQCPSGPLRKDEETLLPNYYTENRTTINVVHPHVTSELRNQLLSSSPSRQKTTKCVVAVPSLKKSKSRPWSATISKGPFLHTGRLRPRSSMGYSSRVTAQHNRMGDVVSPELDAQRRRDEDLRSSSPISSQQHVAPTTNIKPRSEPELKGPTDRLQHVPLSTTSVHHPGLPVMLRVRLPTVTEGYSSSLDALQSHLLIEIGNVTALSTSLIELEPLSLARSEKERVIKGEKSQEEEQSGAKFVDFKCTFLPQHGRSLLSAVKYVTKLLDHAKVNQSSPPLQQGACCGLYISAAVPVAE